MSVHVFDTYAKTSAGKLLHFDVLMVKKDPELALTYARAYLAEIGESDAVIRPGGCAFCHTSITMSEFDETIHRQGYAIYKLEGCPA